ncbi:efflux RND transporter periplasmic adaptor subunit, partial [bacterium AH-315-K03]|nr:efflux RND transporter periplasmic adaptor subunit [bacterium AH-315-K03]
MLKKMILVTLVTLPIAALLVWKSPEEKQLLPESPALLTVESVQAVNNLWDNSLSVRGPLTAWQEAIVSAEINGLAIKAIHVDIGDSVKQGQLLAQLNDATLRAELDQTQAQVDTATSHLSEAKNDITRAQRLEKTKAISAQQLEQFDIALQLAQARFRSAKARQQLSQIKLKQTRIVAIDDGVISARSVNLGEVISAGQEIFRLIRQNRVEWRAELDSEQVFQVNPGMTSRLSLTNGIEIEGVVRQVSPSLNSQTRMAIAYIDLPL